MFLQASVILSTGGGCTCRGGVPAGGVYLPGGYLPGGVLARGGVPAGGVPARWGVPAGGCTCQGGCTCWGGGTCRGGTCSNFSGGVCALIFFGGGFLQFSEYSHRSAGTHPTGMHSCLHFSIAFTF